jgi:NAD(P)H-nitrite reductase large subunit
MRKTGGKVEIAFPDGDPLAADEFLLCTGVRARTGFLAGSGIEVKEGIVVDRRMQTNVDRIYAAGDIAETPDFFTGRYGMNQIIETAMDGGRVAGSNMAGVPAEYEGWISSNVFHFFGHSSFTAGLAMPAGDGYEIMAEKDAGKGGYKKLVFKDNRLVGAMLVNVECDPGVILYLMREKVNLGEQKGQLFEKPQETSRRLMLQAEKRQGASIQG